ncbi:MAG: hypothetical protein KC800_06830 [Candidatus Eremiobacteraeota bacterium]|nr:hypothetical protein [Candidatus Eremiobacteraeota bacterium]
MKREPSNPPKVSLFGVSRIALFLGRACALKDSPVLGIYDPDSQSSLRAALYLGVSARATTESFLKDEPSIVLSSLENVASLPPEPLIICLSEAPGNSERPNLCWAVCDRSEDAMPEQISSESPPLAFRLHGNPEAVRRARSFFEQLPGDIQVSED